VLELQESFADELFALRAGEDRHVLFVSGRAWTPPFAPKQAQKDGAPNGGPGQMLASSCDDTEGARRLFDAMKIGTAWGLALLASRTRLTPVHEMGPIRLRIWLPSRTRVGRAPTAR
jgi:hypothetical protein